MATIFQTNTNELINAHLGPALIFHAPFGTTFPTDIGDVVNLTGTSQWQPKTGWTCLGATKTGIKVERGFTKVDRTSDQSFGPFDSRPNQWTAMCSTEMLETTPENLRIAWEGGAVFTDSSAVNTTMTTLSAVGANNINVASVGTIVSGSVIIIGGNATQEWHKVSTVSGTNLSFHPETLTYAQSSGTTVLLPGKSHQGFGHVRVLVPRVVAVIAPLVKVSATLKANIELLRMYAFRITRLGEGSKTITHTQENDWTLPVTFHAYRDSSITDETIDTYQMLDLTLT